MNNSSTIIDQRKFFANTGVAQISKGNPNFDGSGTIYTLLTASGDGTQVNYISIKATESTMQGMVRFFVNDGDNTFLYREVYIPEMVATNVENSFQTFMNENIYLNNNHSLLVTTENDQKFDIIAFTSDWKQCSCESSLIKQSSINSAKVSIQTIKEANPNRDGSGSITTIFNVPKDISGGAVISEIGIKAITSTREGIVRLWINDGENYYLLTELLIPAEISTSVEPAFRTIFSYAFYLAEGYSICASTEVENAFNISVASTLINNCDC